MEKNVEKVPDRKAKKRKSAAKPNSREKNVEDVPGRKAQKRKSAAAANSYGGKKVKRDGVSPAKAAVSLPASPGASTLAKKAVGENDSRAVANDSRAAANDSRAAANDSQAAANDSQAAANNSRAAAMRTRRIMKELKEIERLQGQRPDPAFTVELVNDNLFEWHVRLYQVDPESELAADLRQLADPSILLHLVFPENFPFAPPFMRVIEPRIEKGYVMEGGAICMELLTPRGWASAYTVEAVVMQFAATVVYGRGRVAPHSSREYSRRRAEEAFQALVDSHKKYGWFTPSLSHG